MKQLPLIGLFFMGLALIGPSRCLNAQDYWTAGANLGAINYYGDVTEYSSFAFRGINPGASITVERSIGEFFLPQFQLLGTRLTGEKIDDDVKFEATNLEASLKLGVNLDLNFSRKLRFDLYPSLNATLAYFDSEVSRITPGEQLGGYKGYNQDQNFGFGYGGGVRLGYDFKRQWRVNLGMDVIYYTTDNIDSYEGLTDFKDMFSNIYAGVGYTFKPRDKKLYEKPEPLLAEEKDDQVNGQFTYQGLPKSGVKLDLYDASEKKLASTVTNLEGRFKFEGLDPETTYLVKLSEEDKQYFNGGDLFIENDKKQHIARASKSAFNAYTFTQLTKKQLANSPVLLEDKPITSMKGSFFYKELPMAGVMVYLLNEEEQRIDSVVTGTDGVFRFNKLDPDQSYLVSLSQQDASEFPDPTLEFSNFNGSLTRRSKANSEDVFVAYAYSQLSRSFLDSDQMFVADSEFKVSGVFLFESLPQSGVKIYLIDDQENVIDSAETGIDGTFGFEQLDPDKDYLLKLSQSDADKYDGALITYHDADQKNAVVAKPDASGKYNVFMYEELISVAEVNQTQQLDDQKTTKMEGVFVYDQMPQSGVKIYLLDDQERIIDSTMTGIDGVFRFEPLDRDQTYLVKLSDEDRKQYEDASITFNDADGKKVKTVQVGDKIETFVHDYKPLENRAENIVQSEIEDEKTTKMEGVFVYDQMPQSGVKVYLLDDQERIIDSTMTGIDGVFSFEPLDRDQSYFVKLSDADRKQYEDASITFNDAEGEPEKSIRIGNKTQVVVHDYDQLKQRTESLSETSTTDKLTDKLEGVFVYENLPEEGVKVYLVDENDDRIDSTLTGPGGEFQFSSLDPDQTYLVELSEEDSKRFENAEFVLLDENHKPEKRAVVKPGEAFTFTSLNEAEIESVLDKIQIEDDEIVFRETTEEPVDDSKVKKNPSDSEISFERETIFFRHNSYYISQNQNNTKGAIIARKLQDNPEMRIKIEGWASPPGTDEYNLLLSQKRADQLKQLLVDTYGIDPSRIEAVGMGEVEEGSMTEAEARRARIHVIQ